jgi:hypothetical protein
MTPEPTNEQQTLESPPGTPSQEPSKIFIDENEWLATQRELSEMKGRLAERNEMELRLGNRMPEVQAPTPPPKPEFHYHSEEELQQALEAGNMRDYHRMSQHNVDSHLKEEIWKLRTTEIDPLRQTGTQAITDLSARLAGQKMNYLDIPEVKKAYDQRVIQAKGMGQILNTEAHQAIYEWAVGTNIEKVQDRFKQTLLRQDAPAGQVNTPSGQPGRVSSPDVPKIPTPEEFFEPAALSKLDQKYQGLSREEALNKEFSRHGGFAKYYTKFYGPKKEEKK